MNAEAVKSRLISIISAEATARVDREVCAIPGEDFFPGLTGEQLAEALPALEEVAQKVGAYFLEIFIGRGGVEEGRTIDAYDLADAIEAVGAATPLCPVIVDALDSVAAE